MEPEHDDSVRGHWWRHAWVFAILLPALACNLYLAFRNPNVGADALGYILPVQNLMAGHGYTQAGQINIYSSPGYGLLTWLLARGLRDLEYAAIAVVSLSYLALVLLSYVVGARWAGRRVGWLAAFFVAFCPALLGFSYVTGSDLPFAALQLAGFVLYVGLLRHGLSAGRMAAFGAVMALACLTRPDTVLTFPVALAVLLGVAVWRRRAVTGLGRDALLALLAVAVFIACLMPYMVFLHRHTGIWTVSNKIGFALMGGGQENPGLRLEDTQGAAAKLLGNLSSTLARVKGNSVMLAYQLVSITFHALLATGLLWLLYPLRAGRSVWSTVGERRGWTLLLGIAVFLVPLGPSLLITPYDRYVLPYATILMIGLAFLCVCLGDGMARPGREWATRGTTLAVAVLGALGLPLLPRPAVLSPVPTLRQSLNARHGHLGLRAAGLWLAEEAKRKPSLRFISRKGSVPLFYAVGKREVVGGPAFYSMESTIEDTVKQMRQENIDYLILDGYYVQQMLAYLPLWKNPAGSATWGLVLCHEEPGLFQAYTCSERQQEGARHE